MSSAQNSTYGLGATQISLSALGASVFPTVITSPANCVGLEIQWLSGGSAMICPNAISGLSIAGATVPANIPGFLIPSSAGIHINGPACFYMACGSSTTAVVGINFHFGYGSSFALS